MPEPSFENPNFIICHEPAESLLRITWQGEVNAPALQAGYQTAIELLKQTPVKSMIIDTSKRQLLMEDSPEPLFGQLFSEALKVIHNTLFIALVLTPEEFFLNSEAARFGHLKERQNEHVIIERFISCTEAEAWLATVG